jgi:hypothetical protein
VPRTILLAASLLGAGYLGSAGAGASTPSAPASAEALGRAVAVIDQCMARLDAEVDVGFRRIALRCPDLPAALVSGGFERWLPRDWRAPDNDLSAGGLEELRELLARELTMRPVSRPPNVQRLRQVLVELGAPQRAGTVWRGLDRWLRKLGGNRAPSKASGGLRVLQRIDLAPVSTRLVAFAALAGLLGLAAVIVLNELRAAGVLRARWRSKSEGTGARGVVSRTAATDVEHVSAAERPRVLLGLILERLSRARGLTGLRSLTAHELIRAVPFDDAEADRQLAQVALTAERVRYAPTPTSASDLAAAADGASALLERLST